MYRSLLISLLSFTDSNQTCSSFSCPDTSMNLLPSTCLYYNSDLSSYYASSCSDDEFCNITFFQNSTCLPQSEALPTKYPGEKCKNSSDCVSFSTKGCISEICQGQFQSEPCISHEECNPGLRCFNSSCSNLLEAGESGCFTDYDCINFAGCLNGTCTIYWSIPIYGEISVCNSSTSIFCETWACNLNYCIASPKTSGALPKRCKADSDCLSKSGTFGLCSCGLNAKSYKYCELFSGDSLFSSYFEALKDWFSTYKFLQCSTTRRFNGLCALDFAGQVLGAELLYYSLYVPSYPQTISVDSCVEEVVLADLYEAKRKFEDATSGIFQIFIPFLFFFI